MQHIISILALIALLSWISPTYQQAFTLSRSYSRNQSLTDNGIFDIFWSIDEAKGELQMALSVQTTGWIGFGFHGFVNESDPNYVNIPIEMDNSDMIIGWIDSASNIYLVDAYAKGPTRPDLDTQL